MNIENIQQRVRVYNKATGINFSYTRFYCFLYLLHGEMYMSTGLNPYINRRVRLIDVLNRCYN